MVRQQETLQDLENAFLIPSGARIACSLPVRLFHSLMTTLPILFRKITEADRTELVLCLLNTMKRPSNQHYSNCILLLWNLVRSLRGDQFQTAESWNRILVLSLLDVLQTDQTMNMRLCETISNLCLILPESLRTGIMIQLGEVFSTSPNGMLTCSLLCKEGLMDESLILKSLPHQYPIPVYSYLCLSYLTRESDWKETYNLILEAINEYNSIPYRIGSLQLIESVLRSHPNLSQVAQSTYLLLVPLILSQVSHQHDSRLHILALHCVSSWFKQLTLSEKSHLVLARVFLQYVIDSLQSVVECVRGYDKWIRMIHRRSC